MDGLREYILRIVAAALISSVVIRLSRGSGNGEMIRMLCGLFLTIVLIGPLAGKKILHPEFFLPEMDAGRIAEEGTAAAEKLRREFIKQRTESYISSRAEQMAAQLQADVTLGKDGIPESVTITGNVQPLSRSKLIQWIASELGIPRERQEWIG